MTGKHSIARDLVIYGFGEIAVKAFGLVTLPLYTRIFAPDEYGLLGVVLTLSSFVMAVVALGSDAAYVRFFFAASTYEERQRITSTWIGFLALWGTAAAVALLPAADQIGRLAIGEVGHGALVGMAFLLAPARLTNLMLAQVLRNEFRPAAYTSLNVIGLAVSVTFIVIAVVALNLGLAGVLGGMLAAELVMLPPRGWAARHMLVWEFSRSALRKLVVFGLPIVPASLAYWVFSASDRILLSNLSGLRDVGLYGVAASLTSLAIIAVTALSQAWTPRAIQAYEEDTKAAAGLYGRALTYILAFFGLLAVGLTTFSRELVATLTGDRYIAAADAVGPLALGVVAYASTQVTSGGITLKRRTSFLALFSWLAALVNVALNVVLIPPFGMVGAAWATAASYSVLTLAYLVTSQRLWRVAYEGKSSALALALTVAFVIGTYAAFPPAPTDPLMVLLKLMYVGAFCAMVVASGVVGRNDIIRMVTALHLRQKAH